ncbi:hypothetical protein [Corallococcus terminator]|uniref:Uncharacterized protein n=1 Tax=Corallococcus terminator TaxID=2316733 RepID=A0A3A8JQN2_9BACT|nr:hypothetical protein [Corallococcus terminator]RKG94110.1 hypothetical protein D7V88_00505 [Corallococcus terminator]
MARNSTLTARLGYIDTQATFVQAALLAAHGAGARAGGFRVSDVRFFFLLFTNWVEHDVTRPSQDIDLTQVRRTLERLVRGGHAEASTGAAVKGLPRGRRYVLTGEGLGSLSEGLAARERAPLEEALFVVCFAASYRDAVLSRVEGRARAPSPAVRRRVERALDPLRLLREAQRTSAAVLADLEERVESGLRYEAKAREALARAEPEADVVRALEAAGSYQLHRVRPLGEVLLALPEDLRKFELTEGMGLRSRLLFAPLAERARAEHAVLERLEARLTAGKAAPG